MPLDPRGDLGFARDRVRTHLDAISRGATGSLDASLTTENDDFFDTENVLVYNIGTGAFRHLTTAALRVRRSNRTPRLSPSGRSFPYLHDYRCVARPTLPTESPTLSFALQGLTSSSKPHEVWWATRSAEVGATTDTLKPFRLVASVPTRSTNLAGVIKPFVDGVISAFHPAAQQHSREAASLIAARTGWPLHSILRHLERPAAPILAPRTVVRPYRSFVKWDPADELCVDLTVVRSDHGDSCRVWVLSEESAT